MLLVFILLHFLELTRVHVVVKGRSTNEYSHLANPLHTAVGGLLFAYFHIF